MRSVRRSVLFLLLAGFLGYGPAAALAQKVPAAKVEGVKAGVIEATALNKAGTFCHLKFPAIDPQTLSSSNPKLKPASTGDIIDFYGPCDYDPVGWEEICKQRVQQQKMDSCD